MAIAAYWSLAFQNAFSWGGTSCSCAQVSWPVLVMIRIIIISIMSTTIMMASDDSQTPPQIFVEAMEKQGGDCCHLINTASGAGLYSQHRPTMGPYVASKHCAVVLTQVSIRPVRVGSACTLLWTSRLAGLETRCC